LYEKEIEQTETEAEEIRTRSILLVDDEEIVLNIAKDLAEELRNKVYTASDGLEALELLDNHMDIDLAIVDRMMPKMDGLALLKRIKKTRPDLAVVMTSGFFSEATENECMENGASYCITKPYHLEDLKRLLQNY